MKNLLWNVDTQFDFMNEKGKLYVGGAEDIIPNLELLKKLSK